MAPNSVSTGQRDSPPSPEQAPGWPLPAAHWLDQLPQGVALLSPSYTLLQANQSLLAYTGLSLQELQGQPWLARLHPADLPSLEAQLLKLKQGADLLLDCRWLAADGGFCWHQTQARLLPEGQVLLSMSDVHERKEQETRLRQADDLWKLALESNGDGVWDWYVQTGVEIYSPRYLQMYGYSPNEIQPSPAEFDALTHPDDLAQMSLDREAHFSGRAPLYSNEHRVRCKDGSWKWILSRGMVISRDEEGRPLRMVGTHTDITARKQSEALIWQQAHFDALTGLPNRRLLRERLEQAQHVAWKSGRSVAVLFIDLDHFKEVNDLLGHAMGDLLLVQATQRIVACAPAPHTVARMGGDEFTVVLSEIDSPQQAEAIAQNILQALAFAFRLEGERVFVSASIGLSLYPADGEQIETLFKHADQALYMAKGAGRNRLCRFTPALQTAAQERARLGNDLHDALSEQQFSLVYQPIVRLSDGLIHKAEALLRWQHPSRGLLGPGEFIPLAETSGLIIEIGEWVFEQVALQVQDWRSRFNPRFQLNINKSPVQFRSSGLPNGQAQGHAWARRLKELGLPGQAIAVEITEGLLLEADELVTLHLDSLRKAGMQVSLDDFGTGYSSLSYLQRLAIDQVKIDKSFVSHLKTGAKELALCNAIITMAHALGIEVVAEGVETEEQHRLLLEAGCDFGQGYWYARPMPAQALEELLKTSGRLGKT
ncbi:bifunctional diguanylate cyclase/phosphodiesterase [Paucibacter sp. KBW04]|uniref:putative bifunctional diguanylate cyclase/phosphodiesterase n=1 Tax=Paucibacter sp. KBW04 TaxID=2153361 RepID=UPI001E589E39|nr:GGDEF and EAL domain-containing protein [Paucibacter sp. KBW04]